MNRVELVEQLRQIMNRAKRYKRETGINLLTGWEYKFIATVLTNEERYYERGFSDKQLAVVQRMIDTKKVA